MSFNPPQSTSDGTVPIMTEDHIYEMVAAINEGDPAWGELEAMFENDYNRSVLERGIRLAALHDKFRDSGSAADWKGYYSEVENKHQGRWSPRDTAIISAARSKFYSPAKIARRFKCRPVTAVEGKVYIVKKEYRRDLSLRTAARQPYDGSSSLMSALWSGGNNAGPGPRFGGGTGAAGDDDDGGSDEDGNGRGGGPGHERGRANSEQQAVHPGIRLRAASVASSTKEEQGLGLDRVPSEPPQIKDEHRDDNTNDGGYGARVRIQEKSTAFTAADRRKKKLSDFARKRGDPEPPQRPPLSNIFRHEKQNARDSDGEGQDDVDEGPKSQSAEEDSGEPLFLTNDEKNEKDNNQNEEEASEALWDPYSEPTARPEPPMDAASQLVVPPSVDSPRNLEVGQEANDEDYSSGEDQRSEFRWHKAHQVREPLGSKWNRTTRRVTAKVNSSQKPPILEPPSPPSLEAQAELEGDIAVEREEKKPPTPPKSMFTQPAFSRYWNGSRKRSTSPAGESMIQKTVRQAWTSLKRVKTEPPGQIGGSELLEEKEGKKPAVVIDLTWMD